MGAQLRQLVAIHAPNLARLTQHIRRSRVLNPTGAPDCYHELHACGLVDAEIVRVCAVGDRRYPYLTVSRCRSSNRFASMPCRLWLRRYRCDLSSDTHVVAVRYERRLSSVTFIFLRSLYPQALEGDDTAHRHRTTLQGTNYIVAVCVSYGMPPTYSFMPTVTKPAWTAAALTASASNAVNLIEGVRQGTRERWRRMSCASRASVRLLERMESQQVVSEVRVVDKS